LDTEAIIDEFHFGGFILFDENFKNENIETFTQKIKDFQETASIPMLIAVDEEGGTVCRVSSNEAFRSTIFPSMRNLLAEGGIEAVLRIEAEKCALLRSVGINVNMAPVCDVTNNPAAFMYQRALGLDPYETAQAIQKIVGLMDSQQIRSVLKHFPGYGNNTDTHIASATDNRPREWFEQQDLVPFRAGIESGCDAILVSHTIVSAFDEEYPASLSKEVHDYIRDEMGFQGVIITDDLAMSALSNSYSDGEAAIQAVLAGNDLICTWEYEEQFQSVYAAVIEGEISIEQINASVLRILHWKQKLGLLDDVL
jgi:beta-N-acetylhexosaminidase